MLHTNLTAQAIDDVLAGTFPASDPPAWTPGLARPAPEGVIDVSRPTNRRTFAQGLASLLGAASLSLLVPVVVLAIGLPVALGVRGLLELTDWLLALVR